MEAYNINDIYPNPANPRTITDEKFEQLVKSIREFPDMSMVRPIVINQDNMIIGGTMRYLAMKQLEFTTVPCEKVDWDEQKQKEFIIKDNVGFGEWDWDIIANEWDVEQVTEWGLDIPNWNNANLLTENDLDFSEEFDPVGTSKGLQRIVFIFDNQQAAESWIGNKPEKSKMVKRNMAWQVNLTTQSIL